MAENSNIVENVLNWLQAGYPQGIPRTDYFPLLALLTRTLLDVNVLHDRNPLFTLLSDGSVRNEGDVQVRVPAPYGIPFGALVPRRGDATRIADPLGVGNAACARNLLRLVNLTVQVGKFSARPDQFAGPSQQGVSAFEFLEAGRRRTLTIKCACRRVGRQSGLHVGDFCVQPCVHSDGAAGHGDGHSWISTVECTISSWIDNHARTWRGVSCRSWVTRLSAHE